MSFEYKNFDPAAGRCLAKAYYLILIFHFCVYYVCKSFTSKRLKRLNTILRR
jgi:hypothetical protein